MDISFRVCRKSDDGSIESREPTDAEIILLNIVKRFCGGEDQNLIICRCGHLATFPNGTNYPAWLNWASQAVANGSGARCNFENNIIFVTNCIECAESRQI